MLAESPYAVFTRVVTHPPDFGVTDQLSEFFEEESSSTSSHSSSSTSSQSSSSSQSFQCYCCNLNPITLLVEGFPDAAALQECECMDGFNGAFLLPFVNFGLHTVTKDCVKLSIESCLWESEPFQDLCAPPRADGQLFRWRVLWSKVDGVERINVVLVDGVVTEAGTQRLYWEREIGDCTTLDETFTVDDHCFCFLRQFDGGNFIERYKCFCKGVGIPQQTFGQQVMDDVMLHVSCTELEPEESTGSSLSPSSHSSSSPSSPQSSVSASSRSSQSSSSSSSTSTSSQSGSSSSSSSSSPSTSSSAPGCQCCDPDEPLSETVYVTIHNLLGSGPCFEPCEDVISPMGIEPCFELTRVDQCTWQGQATQNATCYPDSTVRLTLACNGSTVTMRFTWILDSDDIAIWEKVVNSQYLNCSQCQEHELDPIQFATGCGVSASWVAVNFGRFGGCCEFCPDQYQITIEGVAENDVGGNCEDVDCQQLNGTYLVDFVQRGSSPTGSCTDGIEDWCEYSTPLDLRCTDARFGFCSLHLFLKTTGMCGTKLRVELRADTHVTDDCDANDVRQGWQIDLDGTINPAVDCFNIDVTLGLMNLCLDANWNCTADPITIHVEIPGAEGRTALTRLTPMGVPGRRYGI